MTLSTDLLSGTVLVVMLVVHACLRAADEPDEAVRIPIILIWSFMLADLWPAFDLMRSFSSAGLPVPLLVGGALVAPILASVALSPGSKLRRLAVRLVSVPVGAKGERRLAIFAAWCTGMLILYAVYLIGHWPQDQPVLASYRLGFYWNDARDRWLLLLLPGLPGLLGLLRLARRGQPSPLVWFAGFFSLGLLGAVVHLSTGQQLPFYYRFILVCQVPLAVGVAAFLAHHKSRRAAQIAALTLAAAFAFKVVTLLVVPPSESYFGSRLQGAWSLGQVIPAGSGVVAADPATSYYVPVATGNRVLTLSPGHADSGAEQERAAQGYALLRDLYASPPAQAAAALERMWALGVRWVVVEKFTSLRPPDPRTLFAAPYNGLITGADLTQATDYNERLAAVGEEVADDNEYTVFRLDPAKLAAATSVPGPVARAFASHRGQIEGLLRRLAVGDRATALTLEPVLYRFGVRTVGLTIGALGATPRLAAYGPTLADDQVASIDVRSGRWISNCVLVCRWTPGTATVTSLGRTLHTDPRFTTIVALGAPGAGAVR